VKCYHVARDQPRMLIGRHGEDCRGVVAFRGAADYDECRGCESCPGLHCGTCGWRHVEDLTCPTCVGEAREAIDAIETLATKAWGDALVKGAHSTAAMIVGPVADVDRWQRRHRLVVNAAIDADETSAAHKALVAWTADNRDEQHPLFVLGGWDLLVTEHLGHERTQRVTIARAADYLRANLTDLAQDGDFAFEELHRETRACQAYLEEVLRDGEREETGAPCPCGRADLVRKWGVDEAEDCWMCPRCGEIWTHAEYRLRVTSDYRQHAEALTAKDILAEYRVAEGTVRQWAMRGKVRKRGRDDSGRQLYDVADVLACRDGERMNA